MFTMKRTGGASIGEVIKHQGQLFVITHIVKILECDQKGSMKLQVVAQQYGIKAEYQEAGRFYHVEKCYENGKNDKKSAYERVGKAYALTKEKCGYVWQILYIKPEQEDLLLACAIKRFEPWSEAEMKQAVKKERLATFKVITSQADKQP